MMLIDNLAKTKAAVSKKMPLDMKENKSFEDL